MLRTTPRLRAVITISSISLLVATAGGASAVGAPSPRGSVPEARHPATPHSRSIMAMDAVSGSDVWLVGYDDFQSSLQSIVVHWDGSSWRHLPSNPAGVENAALFDVAEAAPGDVWAVGQSAYQTENLVLHWNGAAWSEVEVPQPAGQYRTLQSVSVISPDNVLASGFVCDSGEGPCTDEVLRWNGTDWATVTRAPTAHILSADAASKDDAIGIGETSFRSRQAVSAHWNGARWKASDLPGTTYGNALSDVAAAGEDDAWAAGYAEITPGGATTGWLLHWDGRRWHEASSAHDPGSFYHVSASAPDDVWLVGAGSDLQHFDGSVWTEESPPLEQGNLRDVQTVDPTDVWAYEEAPRAGGSYTAVLRYDGSVWKVVKRFGYHGASPRPAPSQR